MMVRKVTALRQTIETPEQPTPPDPVAPLLGPKSKKRPRGSARAGSSAVRDAKRPALALAIGIAIGAVGAFPLARARSQKPDVPQLPVDVRVNALINESQRALQDRQPDRALRLLVEADGIGLKNEVVQNNLCVTFNMLGRFEDAIEACKIALVLSPDFTLAKNNLRWAQSQLAQAEAATATAP
jgi:hypothetical protein